MGTKTTYALNGLLQGVVNAIGSDGTIKLYDASSALASTVTLPSPCGVVGGGVLTFVGDMYDLSTVGSAPVTAEIQTSSGAVVISGLTVSDSSLAGTDIVYTGLPFAPGLVLRIVSAQITEIP